MTVESRPVELTVDGRPVVVADTAGTLLDALRDHLGVRAPKDGCSPQGQCGCCTVLVDGVATRLVGRVSMDMLAVDLTPVPHVGIGAEVTLWGRASNGAIQPIDEVARAGDTLGYELMCALAQRVPTTTGE